MPDDAGWADEGDEREPVQSDCRCGECCRMIIEADLDDAGREPRIAERGSPIYAPAGFTESGKPELEDYLLNDEKNGSACTFLDTNTNLCSIYDTRPWVCRVFDCEGEGKEQLIQLGWKPGVSRSR